jgi:hypothetical protein
MHTREVQIGFQEAGAGGIFKRVSKPLKAKELFARKTHFGNDVVKGHEFRSGLPLGKDAMWQHWVAV